LQIFYKEIELLKSSGDKEKELECIRYIVTADSATGNFKEAFDYMQRHRVLYDSVYSEKKNKAAQRMLIEFGVERQGTDNKILQNKYDAQQSRLIIILIAGAILLLGAIFLILLYRQKNEAFKAIEKLQEETAQRNREMVTSNAVKDKLISMIAHDVRSPLASVQNTLTLTREKILSTSEFEQLSQMLEMDIQHLMGMLDNTLLWAREQMIDIGVRKTTFNIYKVVEDIIELYNQTTLSKGVTIYNNIQPDTMVFSDVDIVSTILRNILSNAVKFTPQGKNIYIQQASTKSKILISVKDEGVGITDDVLKKINNKEFISTRGTDNEKGTGLGLLFSKELLLKLGEDFQISSVLGKGTAITISLGTN
jgi:two-component system sensor histidine kinase/response regulator